MTKFIRISKRKKSSHFFCPLIDNGPLLPNVGHQIIVFQSCLYNCRYAKFTPGQV